MADPEPLGEEAIAACDHVVVAVVREVAPEAVGRLARPAAAERVRHDQDIAGGVQGLARPVQFVGERGAQPVGAGAGIALQQQHAVDDRARRVAPRHAHRAVMQPQGGQHLAAREHEIPEDEVVFPVVRPAGSGIVGCHRVPPRRDWLG